MTPPLRCVVCGADAWDTTTAWRCTACGHAYDTVEGLPKLYNGIFGKYRREQELSHRT